MKKLSLNYLKLKYIIINVILLFLISNAAIANKISFEISGNKFTDTEAILSLLKNIPDDADNEYSNQIIKVLNNSNLFSDVRVKFIENKYTIIVKEYPNINNLYFKKNERLDDEELELIASEINFKNFNSKSINLYIDEIKKVYESFGYNNVEIEYSKKIFDDSNTVDLYLNINEGEITKINRISINGNKSISSQDIKEIINSKTKSIRRVFANNNYKPSTVQRDVFIIANYYKDKGFLDIDINTNVEYLKSNRVNLFFNIFEGKIYNLSSIKIVDENNIISTNLFDLIDGKIETFLTDNPLYSASSIKEFRNEISSLILKNGVKFFEINSFEKSENNKIDILFQISSISPKYTKQINIVGNYRTFDYVIRRELDIVEGDAIYDNQIKDIRNKLNSLNLFESVNIKEETVNDDQINLIIEVEEKQTGTFNAGVSVGTLDGFSIVTGLRERNFYGTGRSLDVLVNTSDGKNQFKLITTDRLSYENNADISYTVNYKQQDFSKASSYKLDTFTSGFGIAYKINKNLLHNVELEYVLKDYSVTDTSSVSNSILNSSGENISFLLKNNIRYSTLNPGFISKLGNYINFNNTFETPTSSNNGFIRNIITYKQYHSSEKNIFSIQAKIGNIFSLNNNDILTDDKFSLGGRWLRGFDRYGAGPRNSRSSYVGGNNIVVTKFDYSYEISSNSNFPIYLNLFNDYGLLWENKTTPTNNDNSLRSSAGFGVKYYSPIGPIGFTWGFPIMDEEYDIKRMFLFSIGNID